MKKRMLRRAEGNLPQRVEVMYEPPVHCPDDYGRPLMPYEPPYPSSGVYGSWEHQLAELYRQEHIARKKEQARSRRKVVRATAIVFWFVASWIPTAFGFPGATILLWGLLGVWLTYRAMKS